MEEKTHLSVLKEYPEHERLDLPLLDFRKIPIPILYSSREYSKEIENVEYYGFTYGLK